MDRVEAASDLTALNVLSNNFTRLSNCFRKSFATLLSVSSGIRYALLDRVLAQESGGRGCIKICVNVLRIK
jgi:hypothetical protein